MLPTAHLRLQHCTQHNYEVCFCGVVQTVGIWKGYVNQMAVLLVDTDAGASPSTTATLQRLVQELVCLSPSHDIHLLLW